MRKTKVGWLAIAWAIAVAWMAAAETLPDPEQAGPYPVGVTTVLIEDHSRTCEETGGPRPLLTEIWYPAADDAKAMPQGHLLDTYLFNFDDTLINLIQSMFKVDLHAYDATFRCIGHRDARVRDGVFPLIVFSHGSNAVRCQSVSWCEHMASHGYIVAAPDHTGNCIVTFVAGRMILSKKGAMEESAVERPKDTAFVIDTLERMNKGTDSRFFRTIDVEHIGVAGHSLGGYTTTASADHDARVDAIVPMAGAYVAGRTNYTCPVLVLAATEDLVMKETRIQEMRQYYAESKGPHYLVEFVNGGHFTFTDIAQFVPDFGDGIGAGTRLTNGEPITYIDAETAHTLINGYTTAFFGRYLKGQADYDLYLKANRNPAELIVKWSPGESETAAPARPTP
ncbi:MAG TPA: alpha/beta hydrolase [Candidatus Hydrogenedentes bacterium]|nr:alpha/beta hydrolase [Candidatus Hydrogenedentota bacterium]HPG69967.1 alpha/beta hydrolase [Candidatus Hydrogenedentota bacterium]